MSKTRTENVAKNVVLSSIFQIVAYIIGFVSRTFFIKILGEQYLGLNGVFTNILTLLSFAELGVGSAIVYSMYKPLATKDNEKLKQLMAFYKKIYLLIGTVIIIGGVLLAPFLDFFITEAPDIKENIIIIYLIFVVNSAISYFFSYRTTIISADQKNYLIIIYNKTFHIVRVIIQIIIITIWHNYYLYLLTETVCVLMANYLLSRKSKKMYPELIDIKDSKLPEKEKKDIFKNVKALIIYKVGEVLLNGTDNIIISRYLGLVVAGLYSNYQLLTNAVVEVIGQITNSFTASVGNLNSLESKERKEETFYKILYFTYLLFGFCSIELVILLNDFVRVWIGEQYLLDMITIVMIVGSIYVNGVQYASFSFRNTLGLFKEAILVPIISVIINIVLSIFLAKKVGLWGVFAATIAARFLSAGIIDPYVVYKHEFKKNPLIYFLKYFKYLTFVFITFFITSYIVNFIEATNIILVFIKAIATGIISLSLLILFTFKTKEFNGLTYNFKNLFISFLKRRKK